MKKRAHLLDIFLVMAVVIPQVPAWGADGGRLREQDGIRILELCGTDEERGVIHGELLGAEIVAVLNMFIEQAVAGGKDGYEKVLIPFTKKMNVFAHHLGELHGILQGMKMKTGEAPQIPALGRAITFEDLLALNCIPDVAPVACSTMMAWGKMTADRQTLGGRNLDWHAIKGMADHQLVIVQVPTTEPRRMPWVSVTVPGFIGCLTGMNKHGVVIAMHDVLTGKPAIDSGYCPRGIALRDAIESANRYTEIRNVFAVLIGRPSAVGNLVPVFFPVRPRSIGTPGVIFEYDGHSAYADRVQLGIIKDHDFGIGTNHYRVRSKEAPSCERFDKLFADLSRMEAAGEMLTVEKTWVLLEAVAQPRDDSTKFQTYHSVVFEPAAMKMHVALAKGDRPATQAAKVTIDAAALLAHAAEAGK